jgi:uncharacterized membrane protein
MNHEANVPSSNRTHRVRTQDTRERVFSCMYEQSLGFAMSNVCALTLQSAIGTVLERIPYDLIDFIVTSSSVLRTSYLRAG